MNGDSDRHAPLAMDTATFRSLGHRLVNQVAGFLESLPLMPVTRDESRLALREALIKTAKPIVDEAVESYDDRIRQDRGARYRASDSL